MHIGTANGKSEREYSGPKVFRNGSFRGRPHFARFWRSRRAHTGSTEGTEMKQGGESLSPVPSPSAKLMRTFGVQPIPCAVRPLLELCAPFMRLPLTLVFMLAAMMAKAALSSPDWLWVRNVPTPSDPIVAH